MSTISIKDVAEHAGVSTATVSQVLRDKGRISESTRVKVKESLNTLGYVYNQNAANLRQKTSNYIGLLLHDISNPFYSEMAAGISSVVNDKDKMMFLSTSEGKLSNQARLTTALIQNGASGIILCASNDTSEEYFDHLKSKRIPVVLVTRHEDKGMNFVGTDNVLAGKMATEHLINLGHRRIAFVGGEIGTMNRDNRLKGYASALNDACIGYDNSINIATKTDLRSGKEAIKTILKNHSDVTACIFYQDVIAHGAMMYLNSKGIVAGQDISIVGLDGIEDSAMLTPSLTSVSFSASEMGKRAVELLFSEINNGNKTSQKIIVQPKLIIGESSGRMN